MVELAIAFITVMTAFMLHLVLWKIRVPKRQTRAILLIFFGLLTLVVSLLKVFAGQSSLLSDYPLQPAGYLHIVLFVTACSLAYMITYSAIEVDSPSLVMALAITRAGDAGLPEADFCDMMNNALLVEPRIRDMLRDGLVTKDGDIYRLTSKGKRMARLFALHRRLLGAGMGG